MQMKALLFHKSAFINFLIGMIIFSSSCQKKVQEESVVYKNDFENADLAAITDGKIATFNNARVLGRYNKGGFKLELNNLTQHNMVQISFDLYIHDSWDGNTIDAGGPDLWQMKVDGQKVINTTFVNRECQAYFDCILQSYPAEYPHSSLPRAGELSVNLPGACVLANEKGSSLYRIVRLVKHSGVSLTLECIDQLKQVNTDPSYQSCDESWSVDNIEIKTIEYN